MTSRPLFSLLALSMGVIAVCVALLVAANAAGLVVISTRLTHFSSATSVSCVEQVSILNDSYAPSPVTITQGCTVGWTNTVNKKHTATSDSSTGNTQDPWDSGELSLNQTFTRVFNSPGTYSYYCTIHKNVELGTVIVD